MTVKYRAVLDDLVPLYSGRIHSHKTGWARMLRCMVEDMIDRNPDLGGGLRSALATSEKGSPTVDEGQSWLVAHSMEFSGEGYNLFGGWSADTYHRVRRVLDHPRIVSLERPMPNLRELLAGRAEKTASNFTAAEWDAIELRCAATPSLPLAELWRMGSDQRHIVLGDSHAVAHYRSGALVLRNDGLTLHRLLENGIESYLRGLTAPALLTICAGNIDIRHHLLRLDDPSQSAKNLVSELRRQLDVLLQQGRVSRIEIVAPLPIEHVERKIPGTGCYKGTPFYGSWSQRDTARSAMTHAMVLAFGREQMHSWPEVWYETDPEQFASLYMERPGSVHLSPAWHRWDYETNQPNRRLEALYQ